MERPTSQLENVRPSGLKQPSRVPTMMGSSTRTLVETSQSDLNARSTAGGGGGLMGPPNGPFKHKIPGCKRITSSAELRREQQGGMLVGIKTNTPSFAVPESTPKRKTLAERGGEPSRSHIPGTKPIISRSDSNTAQVGSRVPSTITNASRNASSASTASSTSGMRPPSRPNPSRHARMPSAPEPVKPREEDEEAEADAGAGVMGKRKGTSATFSHTLALRKTRTHADLRHQQQAADMSARSQHSASYIRIRSDASRSAASEQSSRHVSDTSSTSSFAPQEPVAGQPSRNSSLATAFAALSITPRTASGPKHRPSLERIKEEASPSKIPKFACTPSLRHTQSQQILRTPSPLKHKSSVNGLYTPRTSAKHRAEMPVFFLTKDKLTPTPSFTAWDTKGRLDNIELMYATLRTQVVEATDSRNAIEESLSLYKTRVQELAQLNRDLTSANRTLTADLERARNDLHTTTTDLRHGRRDHERDIQDAERRHEKELADVGSRLEKEVQLLERDRERDEDRFKKEMDDAKHKWQRQKDDETADMTTAHWEEMEEERTKYERERAALQKQVDELRRAVESSATESASEVQDLRNTIANVQNQMEATNATVTSLRARISAEESRNAALEQEKTSLISKTHFLEGNQEAQSQEFTTMRQQLQDAITAREGTLVTLRKEEMQRRKLNAMILELRGNIRVFVRTRPLLAGEAEPARVEYPDAASLDGGTEMVVHAPPTLSATGKERHEKHAYTFDRAFGPDTANGQVFDACKDLIQSVVDGYNVSILSYGQTGSGKTFGMSGPDGIIPASIAMLLAELRRLRGKGWEYEVEAAFVEVYNETVNDLLGDAGAWDDGSGNGGGSGGGDDLGTSVRASNGNNNSKRREKHEIHHDPVTGKTTVTNLSSVSLWPPPENEGQGPPAATTATTASSIATATSDATTPTPPEQAAAAAPSSSSSTYTTQAVTALLATAAKNRRVAATKSNERSSRSHSIFMLTLRGRCAATGESSEGVLNLVDLAGSERLKQSGAEGGRARETAAINKSLSALGDVVAALASGGGGGGKRRGTGGGGGGEEGHVPYRNSKLTYLLQSSLGGTAGASGKSSRTLMLLHLSPLQAHWQESRSSLVFGSKVHGTHIGAARKR
ncbi:hypothetical protein LTR36_001890 [Oleoguttula mirabilis]|uniref:Kinesin motor domain-containing protein n=1 Tax=Oleoguttula mirabilis TaxID=1507867 RepID=A0AAV9JMU2_9PEZI|nr:hypothetical protein LTR36_001890 [Oleoguttula mirabilis]